MTLGEPRLSGKAWYLAADPAAVDGLAYARLQAEPRPQIDHRVGFDVDGIEFKVRLDFGAAFPAIARGVATPARIESSPGSGMAPRAPYEFKSFNSSPARP